MTSTGYDVVYIPSRYDRVAIQTTKDEEGKFTSLSLNINCRLYKVYDPNFNWKIHLIVPNNQISIPYTGMF